MKDLLNLPGFLIDRKHGVSIDNRLRLYGIYLKKLVAILFVAANGQSEIDDQTEPWMERTHYVENCVCQRARDGWKDTNRTSTRGERGVEETGKRFSQT